MARRGRGEGTIYKRREGLWEAKIDIGVDGNGRRRRRSVYAPTRREVQEKLDALRRGQAVGAIAIATGERLGAFLERWVRDAPVRESTRRHYALNVGRHIVPAIGRVPLASLTAEQVNAFLQVKLRTGLSPRSVHHLRAVLRNALGAAERWGLISRNVASLADPPKVEDYEARFLTFTEARAFLAAARGDRLEALYSVALALGCRQGEALGLRWRDVDLDTRTLRVVYALQRVPRTGLQLLELKTKSSRRTIHPIPDVVVRALRAHRARQFEERLAAGTRWHDLDFVFTTYEGTPISATNMIRRSFRRICAATGIRMRFHDLRHSAGTLLLAQGVPQRVVMEILGHSSLAMTQKYLHVVPELRDAAAAAMDRALGS